MIIAGILKPNWAIYLEGPKNFKQLDKMKLVLSQSSHTLILMLAATNLRLVAYTPLFSFNPTSTVPVDYALCNNMSQKVLYVPMAQNECRQHPPIGWRLGCRARRSAGCF